MESRSANQQYILITGASSGIGYEFARFYAGLGEKLILVARRRERLETFQQEYPETVIFDLDLSVQENVEKLYNETQQQGLSVKMLINNAGVGLFGDFEQTDLTAELAMIDLNIRALVTLTKLYLIDMKKRNSGEILNVASVAGFMPGPKMAVYYATKAFVSSFSQALAYELRHTQIKIRTLAPGATATEFVKSAKLEQSKLFDRMRVMSAKEVVYYSVNSKQKLIIPGILNKIFIFLLRLAPRTVVLSIVNKLQEKK